MCSLLISGAPPGAQQLVQKPRERLQGVVSRHRLKPALLGRFRIRHSPDGRSLFVQTPSGIYLLRRNPLSLITYIDAERAYPAMFTPDSQELVVVTHGNVFARLNASDGSRLETKELAERSCLQLEVSPDGGAAACVNPTFGLILRDTKSGELLYSGGVYDSAEHHAFSVPIGLDSAFSSPFGFVMLDSFEPLANRGLKFISLLFTPDSASLLVVAGHSGFRIDLAARKKSSLSGNLQKHLHRAAVFQTEERVVSLDAEHENQPLIFSARSGAVLATPNFKADSFSLATNKKYALLDRSEASGATLFDLETDREVATPSNLAADAHGNQLAVLNENGDLYIHQIGEVLPVAVTHLPLDRVSALLTASVDPDLSRFALAVGSMGGMFEIAGGRRILSGLQFYAANFADPASLFLLRRAPKTGQSDVTRHDLQDGKGVLAWSNSQKPPASIHAGRSALIEYSLDSPMGRGIMLLGVEGIPFRLRGIDPATGKQLWSRAFGGATPLPFSDPQGDQLVLGWGARSDGAEPAAHKFPAVWEIFKHAKPAKQDTLFESIDARTGKPTGAALVQAGSGAISYESAFAVGDTLILVKDHRRVSLYSLADSHLKGRIVGEIPSANSHANLLVVSDEAGRLLLYDLKTAEKVNDLLFAEPVAYTHFSEDGKKLFVLSQYQEAFVLDVDQIRHKGAADEPQ